MNINTRFVRVDGQKRSSNLMRHGTLKKWSQNTALNRVVENSERKIFLSLPVFFVCSVFECLNTINNGVNLLVL